MSSVRPITVAEEAHADGQPLTTYAGFFGASQGVLLHLRAFNLRVN